MSISATARLTLTLVLLGATTVATSGCALAPSNVASSVQGAKGDDARQHASSRTERADSGEAGETQEDRDRRADEASRAPGSGDDASAGSDAASGSDSHDHDTSPEQDPAAPSTAGPSAAQLIEQGKENATRVFTAAVECRESASGFEDCLTGDALGIDDLDLLVQEKLPESIDEVALVGYEDDLVVVATDGHEGTYVISIDEAGDVEQECDSPLGSCQIDASILSEA